MAVPDLIASRDLHQFIEAYERNFPDEVVHIERPINAAFEVTALVSKLEKEKRFPVVICHKVVSNGHVLEMPLVTFLMSSRLRLSRALDSDVRAAGLALYERVQRRQSPIVVSRSEAPVKEIVERGSHVNLQKFPAPVHHTMDPGPYLTEGLFLTYGRVSRRDNSAMQRGWIAGRDEIRVYIGPHSHNFHNLMGYEAAGEDMPAAFWVGHHPLVLLGAQTHVPADDSHFATASGVLGSPLRLVPSETLGDDFLVPADAEVVIEGYVPRGQRKPEGPFGEYTRYVGPQRWNPLLKVTAVTHRRNAYWDDVMEGHTHWLGCLIREGAAFRDVIRVVPGLRAVHVPMSGGSVHVYLQIRKVLEGQGKSAAVAALLSNQGNKHAFVFDEDVDIFDDREVLRALAWRFQGDRNLVTLPGIDGSYLDPSIGPDNTTTKLGFDCTKPLGQRFAPGVAVPDEVTAATDLAALIGTDRLQRIPSEPWG